MATLIEHDDVIDLRHLVRTLTEKLDEWSDLSGEEQAEVRNTVDAVRSALADLGFRQADDGLTVETLAQYANEQPTAIAADYFTTYTWELIQDAYPDILRPSRPARFGTVEYADTSEWPCRHLTVNWRAAADDLRQDYSEFDLDGHAYLIRSV